MKKHFRKVATVAMFASLMVACQKDIVDVNKANNDSQVVGQKTLRYCVDGVRASCVLSNEADWCTFMQEMLLIAESGIPVVVYGESGNTISIGSKEFVTYSTSDKDDATTWCQKMVNDGYDVLIEYDTNTGLFVCTATKK